MLILLWKLFGICPFPCTSTVINLTLLPPTLFSSTATESGPPDSVLACHQHTPHTTGRITWGCKSDHVTHLRISLPSLPTALQMSSQLHLQGPSLSGPWQSLCPYFKLFLPHSVILHSNWHSLCSIRSWIFPTLTPCNFKCRLLPPPGTLSSVPSPTQLRGFPWPSLHQLHSRTGPSFILSCHLVLFLQQHAYYLQFHSFVHSFICWMSVSTSKP